MCNKRCFGNNKPIIMDAHTTSPATILIIDDAAESLYFLEDLLHEHGYAVRVAPDGKLALESIQLEPPDLILLDIMLPEIGGFELCKKLKADERTRDIPVIFISVLDEVFDKVRAFEVGGIDYITKPFEADEVLAHVKTHLAAQESETRFRKVIEHNVDAILVVDQDSKIRFANPAAKELFHLEREELIGKTFAIPVMQGEPTELEIPKYDGSSAIIEIRTVEIEWDHAPAYLASLRDITGHKRAAEEVLLLKNAIETAEIGVTITDVERKILYTNRAEAEMHGYAVAELQGKDVRIFSPQEYWHDIDFEDLQKNWKRESVNIRKDGKRFPVHSISTPVRNESGEPIGIITVSEDITERHKAEEELQQAKEAAESANRAKSEFLANMSHELRTPLNAILGYSQILSHDRTLSEKQCDAIATIQRSGEHLLTMINDILDLSKIEAQKIELAISHFALSGFLHHVTDMIRIRTEHKGIRFISSLAPDLPTHIQADEKRLRQILLNWLSNAVKFTTDGIVEFHVSTSRPANATEVGARASRPPDEIGRDARAPTTDRIFLRFEVRDTGIGIPQHHLTDIFQPFQQVGDTRFQAEGTGLGLSISQKLLLLMDSTLHVESTPQQGSTFWFVLPVFPGDSSSEDQESPFCCRICGFQGPARRILLVDDQEENRAMLREMLQPVGFEIFEACNGCEALEQTNRFKPDLIFMDLLMPVMDGIEAAKKMRDAHCHIPIIAVSASAFGQTREDSIRAGCDDFLVKPLTERALFDVLQHFLQLQWICEDENAEQPPPEEDARMTPLPHAILAELHHLSLIGDIFTIQRRLEEIERSGSQYRCFLRKARHLAKDLKLLEIQQFFKQYLDE